MTGFKGVLQIGIICIRANYYRQSRLLFRVPLTFPLLKSIYDFSTLNLSCKQLVSNNEANCVSREIFHF